MNHQPTLPIKGLEHPHSPAMVGIGNRRVAVVCCGQSVVEGPVVERDWLVRMAEQKGHKAPDFPRRSEP